MMTLADLTSQEIDSIVDEWAGFARTMLPVAKDLSDEELRDHARVILVALVEDMRTTQSGETQHDKSRGSLPDNAPNVTKTARAHSHQRFAQGFTLDQMVAEYRALRASIIRRWAEQHEDAERGMLSELTRFGETLDQGLKESVSLYAAKSDESRNLLLGVLGHDMRNPLGAARMSAQYLLRTEGLDDRQTKAVVRILNSTEKLQAMVGDILDFTQTAFGRKLPITRVAVDLRKICATRVDAAIEGIKRA